MAHHAPPIRGGLGSHAWRLEASQSTQSQQSINCGTPSEVSTVARQAKSQLWHAKGVVDKTTLPRCGVQQGIAVDENGEGVMCDSGRHEKGLWGVHNVH